MSRLEAARPSCDNPELAYFIKEAVKVLKGFRLASEEQPVEDAWTCILCQWEVGMSMHIMHMPAIQMLEAASPMYLGSIGGLELLPESIIKVAPPAQSLF